jgi:hypothetical protein
MALPTVTEERSFASLRMTAFFASAHCANSNNIVIEAKDLSSLLRRVEACDGFLNKTAAARNWGRRGTITRNFAALSI